MYHTECMASELSELVGKGAMKVTVLFLRQRAPIWGNGIRAMDRK